jgi:hypothetical protein
MNSEQALLQKLQISKKIMEKHNDMGRRNSVDNNINVETYEPVKGTYNIPQEYLSEEAVKQKQQVQYENSEDKILNSRLPDEIKRLMIEHPIQQPANTLNSSVLSNDLVEKASRLMNVNANGDYVNEPKQQRQTYATVPRVNEFITNLSVIPEELIADVQILRGSQPRVTSKLKQYFLSNSKAPVQVSRMSLEEFRKKKLKNKV